MRIDYGTEEEPSTSSMVHSGEVGDAEMMAEDHHAVEMQEADMWDETRGETGGVEETGAVSSEVPMAEVDPTPSEPEGVTTVFSTQENVSLPSTTLQAPTFPPVTADPSGIPSELFVIPPTSPIDDSAPLVVSSTPVPLTLEPSPAEADPSLLFLGTTEALAPKAETGSEIPSLKYPTIKLETENDEPAAVPNHVSNSTIDATTDEFKQEQDLLGKDSKCTCGALTSGSSYPLLQIRRLSHVDIDSTFASSDANPTASSSSSFLPAPPVLLVYANDTYSLFRRDSTAELDQLVLFGEEHEQSLYFDRVEKLLDALHELFPDLRERQEELVLSFEAIGISLSEVSRDLLSRKEKKKIWTLTIF